MKRLRVVVERDRCDAHGVCVSHAPNVFAIGDDDQMHLLVEFPPAEEIPRVEQAVEHCPKCALSLEEV